MILSCSIIRLPSTLVRARLTWWEVGGHGADLAVVQWDPSGPLTIRAAARRSLELVLDELERQGR